MPIVKHRSILTGIRVEEAMRRNVSRLPSDATVRRCIRYMIKFKSNAVLVDDGGGMPAGVVSKTDVMGAYYANLPLETGLGEILTGPPQFCYPDDDLEDALDIMQDSGIHRLYVMGADAGEVQGTLAYGEIVGLLSEGIKQMLLNDVQRRAVSIRCRPLPLGHLQRVYCQSDNGGHIEAISEIVDHVQE